MGNTYFRHSRKRARLRCNSSLIKTLLRCFISQKILAAEKLLNKVRKYCVSKKQGLLSHELSEQCISIYFFLPQKEENENGNAVSKNYNVCHRPRRQDFLGYLMENGAFYITSKERLLTFQNRISGNIKIYEMSEDTAYEIDEPSDWIIIEELLRRREMSIGLEGRLKKIKLFFCQHLINIIILSNHE